MIDSQMSDSKSETARVRSVSILGVRIANLSVAQAIDVLHGAIDDRSGVTRAIYIVNAHTLNLASTLSGYRNVLNDAAYVFADGTGARWAARWSGTPLQANLVGTDLIPALFARTAGQRYRYFMLGGDQSAIERAARASRRLHPGWKLAGFHHGYVWNTQATEEVIDQINRARPHLLLVGMGNPLQEQWIHQNRHRLTVPVAIGVGGLFDHWAGNLTRAPAWVRRHGLEWAQLLLQQPHKWRRYLVGNPLFVARVVRSLAVRRLGPRVGAHR